MIDDILKRVNARYAERKCPHPQMREALRYEVQSDQVLALMEVLVEEIAALRLRVEYLEDPCCV